MKIISNEYSLRYSGDYLNNVGVKFKWVNAQVFEMCQENPDVVITNHYHEAVLASQAYPMIKFVGKGFSFPNYHFDIPPALLDELSVLNKSTVISQPCDIAYFNDSGRENVPFINKLRNIGITKIMGPGFCLDELDKNFPQRLTPAFYLSSRVVGATSKEEALKALFMGKPCIYDGVEPYCYRVNEGVITLRPRQNGISHAWNHSHTVVWSGIFNILGEFELAEKLESVIKFDKEEVTK